MARAALGARQPARAERPGGRAERRRGVRGRRVAQARIAPLRGGKRVAEVAASAPTSERRGPRGARGESLNKSLPSGDPLGRLGIRAIGLESIVVQGAGTESLRKGPGHYSDTDLPGSGGTVAIAGHRTTFAAPFRRLDRLSRGDEVVLSLPYAHFTYRVEGSKIVQPADLRVLRQVRHERLVLTACHPLYSDAQRIVVFARLARTEQPKRLPF